MAKKTKRYAWKDPAKLGRVAAIVLGINAAIFAVTAVAGIVYGGALRYEAGTVEFTGPQTIKAMLDLATFAATLACVTVLMWIVRSNVNARTFNPHLKNSPFGSIAWYVVPFASFYKPYEAMSEIWTASARSGDPSGRLLGWWWAAFLVNNAMAFGSVASPAASTIEVAYDLLAMTVSLLFMQVIRQVTQMQVAKRMIWTVFGEPDPNPQSVLERAAG